MPLQKLPVTGLDDPNHRRRAREVLNGVLDHSFDDSRAQSQAEKVNGITPINTAFGFFDPRRYGAVGDGTTDDTAAVQKACDAAAINGGTVIIPQGLTFKCTANISVHVGDGTTVDVVGEGFANGGLLFSGAAVTTGLSFIGLSAYQYCGSVRNLRIRGQSSAVRGVTFQLVNNPRIERCRLSGFTGAAVAFLGTILGVMDHVLITGCGSASEGTVEVDASGSTASTTFKWDHCYISGGDTTVGGLIINRTYHTAILGGAIESVGIPLRIGHRSDTTIGCVGGVVHGIDLENPGNSNHYIDLGAGLSSAALLTCYDIAACNGSPSGTTTVNYAVKAATTRNIQFRANNWTIPNGTSFHEFTGTANFGAVIEPHYQLAAASGTAWVRVNSAQVMAAGPQQAWAQRTMQLGLSIEKTVSGTNPTCSVDDTQGGFHRRILLFNGSPTNMATLGNGEEGMEVFLRAGNTNTTIVNNPGTTNAFRTATGANIATASGQIYQFIRGATDWAQVA